ncbi:hypothetical protein NDU88_001650 [Pleurodeles waltl]|uniref:Uncharacterized protein n=1 Tax=Pleurodeles waltl TaxID=8319 RepID=A0AAV7R964_PLEWA|nr:hypothetical protein NDU88_001650 [Pleurodeles waltl]
MAYAEHLQRLRLIDYKAYIQRTHPEVDKSGALLARLIHPTPPPTPILTIHSETQGVVNTQLGINTVFRDFYADLYTAPTAPPDTLLIEYLNKARLPQITPQVREELGADLTVEEIKGAVRDMSSNKTPVSDGLPVELYNIYIHKRAPQLLKLYNY